VEIGEKVKVPMEKTVLAAFHPGLEKTYSFTARAGKKSHWPNNRDRIKRQKKMEKRPEGGGKAGFSDIPSGGGEIRETTQQRDTRQLERGNPYTVRPSREKKRVDKKGEHDCLPPILSEEPWRRGMKEQS